ncbi:hypothetical protein ACLOJK_014382 [Asimina triloba]
MPTLRHSSSLAVHPALLLPKSGSPPLWPSTLRHPPLLASLQSFLPRSFFASLFIGECWKDEGSPEKKEAMGAGGGLLVASHGGADRRLAHVMVVGVMERDGCSWDVGQIFLLGGVAAMCGGAWEEAMGWTDLVICEGGVGRGASWAWAMEPGRWKTTDL